MYVSIHVAILLHVIMKRYMYVMMYCTCRYGVGYHMVIVKEPFCDARKVNHLP